jgi:hypothetical protein
VRSQALGDTAVEWIQTLGSIAQESGPSVTLSWMQKCEAGGGVGDGGGPGFLGQRKSIAWGVVGGIRGPRDSAQQLQSLQHIFSAYSPQMARDQPPHSKQELQLSRTSWPDPRGLGSSSLELYHLVLTSKESWAGGHESGFWAWAWELASLL